MFTYTAREHCSKDTDLSLKLAEDYYKQCRKISFGRKVSPNYPFNVIETCLCVCNKYIFNFDELLANKFAKARNEDAFFSRLCQLQGNCLVLQRTCGNSTAVLSAFVYAFLFPYCKVSVIQRKLQALTSEIILYEEPLNQGQNASPSPCVDEVKMSAKAC